MAVPTPGGTVSAGPAAAARARGRPPTVGAPAHQSTDTKFGAGRSRAALHRRGRSYRQELVHGERFPRRQRRALRHVRLQRPDLCNEGVDQRPDVKGPLGLPDGDHELTERRGACAIGRQQRGLDGRPLLLRPPRRRRRRPRPRPRPPCWPTVDPRRRCAGTAGRGRSPLRRRGRVVPAGLVGLRARSLCGVSSEASSPPEQPATGQQAGPALRQGDRLAGSSVDPHPLVPSSTRSPADGSFAVHGIAGKWLARSVRTAEGIQNVRTAQA